MKKKTRQRDDDANMPPQKKEVEEVMVSSFSQPLIPDIEESRIGGSFKTRILKPLSEVTYDDVLDALPPAFKGGRRTIDTLCLKARDITIAQIGQLVGNDDTIDCIESKKAVAEYLKRCLDEYIMSGCKAPEWGVADDNIKR
jgi:hypothetical protein